jgi:hypothetical protein
MIIARRETDRISTTFHLLGRKLMLLAQNGFSSNGIAEGRSRMAAALSRREDIWFSLEDLKMHSKLH